jgi:hypothetical protein
MLQTYQDFDGRRNTVDFLSTDDILYQIDIFRPFRQVWLVIPRSTGAAFLLSDFFAYFYGFLRDCRVILLMTGLTL